MKAHKTNCILNEYRFDELNNTQQQLIHQAHHVCKEAYAPYSNFKVGASLLLETGTVVCGNNQENAAYPSGLCAERIAFFSAGSNYPEQNIKQIAIVTQTKLKLNKTIMPCGSCRQVMIEYEKKQGQFIEILLQVNDGSIFVSNSIQNILPFAFECLELKNA